MESEDGLHEGGLAAAALADDGDGFAGVEVEADVVDGADGAGASEAPASELEPGAQVAQGE